jgi:hypothetical protein
LQHKLAQISRIEAVFRSAESPCQFQPAGVGPSGRHRKVGCVRCLKIPAPIREISEIGGHSFARGLAALSIPRFKIFFFGEDQGWLSGLDNFLMG